MIKTHGTVTINSEGCTANDFITEGADFHQAQFEMLAWAKSRIEEEIESLRVVTGRNFKDAITAARVVGV